MTDGEASPLRPQNVTEAIGLMTEMLARQPLLFQQLGGPVSFHVKALEGEEDTDWTFTSDGSQIRVDPELSEDAVVTVGISVVVLCDLMVGQADIEEAMRTQRLMVRGDASKLELFGRCLAPMQSAFNLLLHR